MDSIIIKIFKSSIWSSLGLLVLGILLIFQSEITIISISYIIGALLIAIGVIGLVKYLKSINNKERNELDIIYGIVTIILGIMIITNPQAIAGIIPFIIGIIIIVASSLKLQYSMDLKKNKNDLWKSTMILSIISILCGILLIFNPFKGAVFITKVIGSLIIIYSILDIVSSLSIRKTSKTFNKEIEKYVTEANVVNEETEHKKTK